MEVLNLAEMVRVTTRISAEINDWLDDRTNKTGIPKSTLILLALEQYINQHNALNSMKDIEQVLEQLNLFNELKGIEGIKK